ncbi:DUF3298 and DUF4163 domain-containing protein [Spongiimicrobium salis]|uniref:DUF3298 and DUF4163 domain-containing protein n=1 Tax=Spongiimicrobium salis TaxID=1667022 RepID=UPI00374CBCD8
MRAPLYLLFFSLLFLSCTNADKLAFEPKTYQNDKCSDCPTISIAIPNMLETSTIANTINNALKEEIIAQLTFDDNGQSFDTIEGAMQSFSNGYEQLKAKFPDETVKWEATIKGEIIYEDTHVVTIACDSYIFTGGAHGYGSIRYLNFDKKKGLELENWELFADAEDFKRFAELKFRIQENIPQDDNINSTGYMFENEEFYLPENIGFTDDGLLLHYNQYDVASYADGPIVVKLPYDEIKNYLARRIKS